MKYVVAVSGGVDSVVLLDMLARGNKHGLVVAHFDHGIREDSAADACFVSALAEKYEIPFETKREELGKNVNEETARSRRYEFLKIIANEYDAPIVTAHHKNDLIETIAINLTRGTGWRGLAVFGNKTIERPLVDMTKAELYEYALVHNLEWVEDATNAETAYLRNRLRTKINGLIPIKTVDGLVQLWQRQNMLRTEIDTVSSNVLTKENRISRYFFTCIDDQTAIELLGATLRDNDMSLTRPQRQRLLHAIKTAPIGSTYEAGAGVSATFTKRDFIVKSTL